MKRFVLIIALLATLIGSVSLQQTSNALPLSQRAALKLPLKNPRIVVLKSKRRLELYSDGALVRTYKVGLGLNPVPDKVRQGDRATPEGEFYIFTKNNKSAFYLSLGISYPNIEDAERGRQKMLLVSQQKRCRPSGAQNLSYMAPRAYARGYYLSLLRSSFHRIATKRTSRFRQTTQTRSIPC